MSMWCVAPLEMNEGNSLGQGYIRPTGCGAEMAPHATFNFLTTCHCPEPDQPSPCSPPSFNPLFNIHFNLFPSMPRSCKWFLHSVFPTKTLHAPCTSPLPYTCYMPCSSNSWFDHPNKIWWGVQIIKFLFMWSSSLPWYPLHFISK